MLTDAERETFEITVDLSGLLKGDHEARWRANEIALRNGVLTVDEIREQEGWLPLGESDAPQGEGMA